MNRHIDVQLTLFGEWSVVREWGRIGQPGSGARA
ncbi:WGR domain-containing protein [Bradyrhizobium sp. U87765 SZCCT0131]|nr:MULTISPECIES: WGR domain-containing protein [unclassified Bradyrhizobium]MBR1221501.1 WGR domain-containing protein [Bradyrhizobium sp. U87765 SZCCT0131]MBR1264576.1 WGR domain-containing protein [Bradyrhizobium sp. U87765 SZCCT0134]MBR1304518.1 WGR domain-containing protein [Bradyrhizobium sp. U87765 SZCCT0110]MBR1322625.1 WGR domain-containing protein [Bradyrhizobium sp. U87765 SZCCT0109]MBR1346447.1 WGR domain-containing protein [Bradyrhizobium sp. U87765 SZCCT0048]